MRSWTRLLVLVGVAGALGPAAATADAPESVADAALRFLRAFRSNDEPALASVAADAGVDPVDVAATLWVWRVSDRATAPSRPVGMEVLRELARRTAGRRDARDLGKAIEAHAALGDDVLAAEERRRAAWNEATTVPSGVARAEAFERLLGDPDALPTTFLTVSLLARAAEVEEQAGRTEAASALYAAAGRRGEEIPWPRLSAAVWERRARACVASADWRGAAAALERSAAVLESLGRDDAVVGTLLNLSLARRRQGRLDAANAAAVRAEEISARGGDVRGARAARRARAEARIEAGDYGEAEPILRALASEAHTAGDAGGESSARLELAVLLHRTGRLAEALTLSEQEIERLARLGPSTTLAAACRNAAVMYREMGLPERSLALHERARAAYEAAGDRAGVVASLLNLGAVAATLGRFDEARERYLAVVEARRAGGDVREVALARVNLAALEREAGRPEEALALCSEALRSLEAAGLPVPPGVLRAVAASHEALGHAAESMSFTGRAVAAVRSGATEAGPAARVLYEAALAYARAGRPAEALPLAERCLALRRDAAGGFDPVEGETLGARVAAAAELGVSVVVAMRESGAIGGAEATDRAFRFAEWGRALALAEALSTSGEPRARNLPDDLREDDVRSRSDVDRARARLEQALSHGARAAIDDARSRLAAADAAREDVVERLHRSDGTEGSVTWPEPPDAATARGALRPDEALVIYQRAPDRLRAVVLRPKGGALVDLGPAADLEGSVAAWVALASVPGGPEETLARRLGARLLDPLAAHLEGATTWLVAPDGVLAFVPFDALRIGPAGARAVERATFVLVPSTSALVTLRTGEGGRAAGDRVLALGDPSLAGAEGGRGAALGFSDATALPASAEEARTVVARFPEAKRTLLLGKAATASGLRAALAAPGGTFRVVHLACHARLDTEHPRLSGLLLADGDVLDLDDVHRLRVDADVVVLSGCETGRGRLLTSEGVLGLTRGFFVAGARRVVASAWKVGDASTLDLMRRFYAALADGAPPAVALARAKRETIALGGDAAHPSRWAAFSLWGLPE